MNILKLANRASLDIVLFTLLIFATGSYASSVREELVLDTGWKFLFSDTDKTNNFPRADFNDAAWQTVSVPHTWNNVGYYLNDIAPHINTAENTNKQYGIGWYRLNFKAKSSNKNQQAWLEFDAASRTAEVWLNGVRLGEHRGGFTRFRFDATQVIHFDQNNVLVVKTDNTKPTADSSTADTLPIAGDFFVHGGLYRDVRIVLTEQVHFDMLDYGGSGVYATTDLSNPEKAQVSVESRIKNDTDSPRSVRVRTQLMDANGKSVVKAEEALTLEPQTIATMQQNLLVANPKLWQGQVNPYLYTLRTEILGPDNTVLDALDQQYGLRSITITPDKGLFLNGKPLRLQGVAYHQDKEGRGWAVSHDDVKQDVDMLVNMGANTLRLAHYPHGQDIHELANELGLIIWDEIPLVSAWRYGEEHVAVNQALLDNARLQLKEMIKQNFNHPSVAVWGIANEVDFGALIPAFLGSPAGSNPDPLPILRQLAKDVKLADPSRYSTLANCCEGVPTWPQEKVPKTTDMADTTGLNRYFGWYYSEPEQLSRMLDKLHAQYPQQPLSVSEYGAGGALSLHTDNVLGGPVAATGHDQPEEYMSYVHEANWAVLRDKPYLWATWIWNAFDFATTVRVEGDSNDINTKGLISYDRNIKKDAYFFYQANWTSTPMVHVTSSRYSQRRYQVTDIRVYSNLASTELWLNGKSLGVKTDCPLKICVWENAALNVGDNSVIAKGIGNQASIKDQLSWQLNESQSNHYFIDAGALVAAPSQQHSYGSDNLFNGGIAATLDKAGGWGRPPIKPEIKHTADRDLAATYRRGKFIYELPLKNGRYTVRLLVVNPPETESSFAVKADGKKIFEVKTIANDAIDALRAEYHNAEVDVVDGRLNLSFEPSQGDAFVSAIEVMPKH